MQPDEERTPEQDIAAVNALATEQVWLCALTLAVPNGSRVVNSDVINTKLGLDEIDAESIGSILSFCVNSIASKQLSPASVLNQLCSKKLDMERATLLVDIATFYAKNELSQYDISISILELGKAIADIKGAIAPPKK